MFYEDFKRAIEAFLTKHQMSATAFGTEALGDPGFVFDLRRGRSCGLKIVDKVYAFMEKDHG
jgi:hypothetical protein